MLPMFERYNEQARRVLFFARYEVSELGGLAIEPEHVLLGLIREDQGVTGRLFARFGISREDIRRELDRRSAFREKVATSVEIPFSQAAKRILQFAAEEADRLLHNYIGPEHLLLGILRDERSVAAAVLIDKGMRADAVRMEVVRLLNEQAALAEDMARPQPTEQLRVRWTLRLRGREYWFEREGEAPEGPYCVRCWEQHRRWARKVADASGHVSCEYCGREGQAS